MTDGKKLNLVTFEFRTQADTSVLETEVDRIRHKFYDLTEDEIQIAEGKR